MKPRTIGDNILAYGFFIGLALVAIITVIYFDSHQTRAECPQVVTQSNSNPTQVDCAAAANPNGQ